MTSGSVVIGWIVDSQPLPLRFIAPLGGKERLLLTEKVLEGDLPRRLIRIGQIEFPQVAEQVAGVGVIDLAVIININKSRRGEPVAFSASRNNCRISDPGIQFPAP